ncbi:MAG: (Fe-S)-binding protein [Bacteroidales bacterium]|nr:(Fe-S)-binding protein [Bacteroidales bacterium]HOL99112.1 (Fe-S)-binding protein [Bacteroidales bacterium]HOM37501.1 (Fe-S)-binding protein [Bacteroidales bacterium]HPD24967.1 (Fe-S)-binding protein [Bacteroidales bacterium]HRT00692.1 (Fe-S)-binding protein [Bacteroidales bacterium]
MNYNPFIIPFTTGAIILFAIIIYKFIAWYRKLDKKQRFYLRKNILTFKSIEAIKESFLEALIHRNIYKKNLLLGYMHMSLAFGWFLLIIFGKIEASLHAQTLFEEPWLAIFFRYFVRDEHKFFMSEIFPPLMDFLLLVILSGVLLAWLKRFSSSLLGMKKTTRHSKFDKIALASLWWIFPLRLLSESSTAALTGNGSFLTGTVGNLMAVLNLQYFEIYFWWAYSICLFAFFVSLPFSRYMHIPTEVVFIFLKKWGATAGEEYSGYTDFQLNACSRCGICIDVCQMNFAANIQNVQSVYFIRDTRYKHLKDETANNCLMCGRCVEACPVGLELTVIRQQLRNKKEIAGKHYYDYTKPQEADKKYDIVYFAGCMTHLTPSIIISMKKIFEEAGINYWFMDENKGTCCGRPMRQQGFIQQSKDLISINQKLINSSGAKTLVTSCPICYKSFKEEYVLDIEIKHHSEFINELIENNKIKIQNSQKSIVYHDPCELGRGSGIYEEPRNILAKVGNLKSSEFEKQNSLCCGGSLSNAIIELEDQIKIRNHALENLTACNPDILATACPLCKKTFVHGNKAKVMDIAEIIAENISLQNQSSKHKEKNKIKTKIEL